MTGASPSEPDQSSLSTLTWLQRRERLLWVLAIGFYGLGDTVTTFWGLSTPGVAEAGPIAGPAIEAHGRRSLLVIKVVLFTILFGLWSVVRTPGRVAIPLALVVVGVFVTVWNAVVVLSAP